jgi:hypothetical protein
VKQVALSKTWLEVLTAAKMAAWKIPPEELSDPDTGLIALTADASSALAVAMSTERTVGSTAHCTMAFTALEEKMRYMKRLYFNCPPRTLEDMAILGLTFPDSSYTSKKAPMNEAGLEWNKWAPHLLGFRIFTSAVIDPNETGYGVRVYSGLVKTGIPPGERPSAVRISDDYHLLSSPPLSPADLPDSFFTRRKSDILQNLPAEASGMMCYLSARYEIEKGHAAGPIGTLISAIVP